jgi:hypothetical protein
MARTDVGTSPYPVTMMIGTSVHSDAMRLPIASRGSRSSSAVRPRALAYIRMSALSQTADACRPTMM